MDWLKCRGFEKRTKVFKNIYFLNSIYHIRIHHHDAHLEKSSSQIHQHEDGRQCGVTSLHQINGVQEDHVTGDDQ